MTSLHNFLYELRIQKNTKCIEWNGWATLWIIIRTIWITLQNIQKFLSIHFIAWYFFYYKAIRDVLQRNVPTILTALLSDWVNCDRIRDYHNFNNGNKKNGSKFLKTFLKNKINKPIKKISELKLNKFYSLKNN